MKRTVFGLLVLWTAGCGVRFADQEVMNTLPDYFKARNLYPDTSGINRYKLTELAGSILHRREGTAEYEFKKVLLKPSYVPKLEIIPDEEGKVFSATIDKGASVNGSYLAFAANLSDSQVATVSIRDRNMVFVSNSDVPWDLLKQEAQTPVQGAVKRYWVKGALLASVDSTAFSEIKADASGVVGEAFGAKGKVYNKRGQETHDYRISVELIDLDKVDLALPTTTPAAVNELVTSPERLKNLEVKGEALIKIVDPRMKFN